MNNHIKEKRGGARIGAGRPTLEHRNITISFRCSEKEKEIIFKAKEGKSLTDFLLSLVNKKI